MYTAEERPEKRNRGKEEIQRNTPFMYEGFGSVSADVSACLMAASAASLQKLLRETQMIRG